MVERSTPEAAAEVSDAEELVGPVFDPAEDEADVGPVPPKAKKRRIVLHEAAFLEALPSAGMYERSFMHRDTVTHAAVAARAEFFFTASTDGHLKFWKKGGEGIEFVKSFRAHLGPITAFSVSAKMMPELTQPISALAVSHDNSLLASLSANDRSLKVFDVATFDMIGMLRLPFAPSCAEWVYQTGRAQAVLAISDQDSPSISTYDVRGDLEQPLATFAVHRAPVLAMRYVPQHDAVISFDDRGNIEYWRPADRKLPEAATFTSKLDTDLYALARIKAHARSIAISADGTQFGAYCSDRRVRVWRFATGKLRRTYDESPEAAAQLQREGPEGLRLEAIDFGRRQALDKELAQHMVQDPGSCWPCLAFDESGNFVLFPSLLGIKVVNMVANRVCRVIGLAESNERFLSLALFQGKQRPDVVKAARLGDASRQPAADPTVVATAFQQQRLYVFSKREPADYDDAAVGRDVFNEKPAADDILAAEEAGEGGGELPRGAVLHTTKGDVHLKLFPDECPKTVENFATHARNGYFDGVIFHRVIKGFMVQTGDPLGDGTGGQSIWGVEFGDEFSRALRHDRPFTMSMANSGPSTNGSQFFLTTVPTPWLDNKHTVFGRVVKGADVVLIIERSKTDKNDKPFEDIKIMNISVQGEAA